MTLVGKVGEYWCAAACEGDAHVVGAEDRVPEVALVGVVVEEEGGGEIDAGDGVFVGAGGGVVRVGAVGAVDDGTLVVEGVFWDGEEVEG